MNIFKVEEGFIRVSFFVPEKYYQESIETVFNTILKILFTNIKELIVSKLICSP